MSEIFGNGIMGGGGLTNSKLALADAQPEDVRSGKKFYSGDKQIKTGTNPDVAQATPTITVDTAGKITAAATQTAGIVPAGTKSATKQLTIQAGKTVTPSISAQTAVASQRFTTGDVKVAAVNGIIRVTYPARDTCTCKNGSTTLTANASDGITVFIVPNTGTWTLTVTNGTKTATKTVSITATSRFANVTLAYFTATIEVTYPAKSKCVIKNSSGTQVASNTNTGTAAKTWTATVNATGTYTVTATATDGSGKTKSTTVSITANGQVETVTLTYELVLFDGENGGDNTAVTGGWLTFYSYSASVNVSAEKITMDGGEGYLSAVATKNAVDLSEYSTLFMRYKINSARGDTADILMFGVAASSAGILNYDTAFTASKSLKIKTTSGVVDLSCDISSVNTGAVGVNAKYEYNIDIFKIWLE